MYVPYGAITTPTPTPNVASPPPSKQNQNNDNFSSFIKATSLNALEASTEDHHCLFSYIPIMERFSGSENWPKRAVILPGIFSLYAVL